MGVVVEAGWLRWLRSTLDSLLEWLSNDGLGNCLEAGQGGVVEVNQLQQLQYDHVFWQLCV